MSIGTYVRDTSMQKWYESNIHVARSIINSYPNLNRIFYNLDGYEDKAYRTQMSNFIVLKALPPIGKSLKENNNTFFVELEKLINDFKILEQTGQEYKAFLSRIKSDKYDEGVSTYTELVVAGKLAEKIGINNVFLFPLLTSGNRSDILLSVDGKKIFVEITNLTERRSQRKIQNILDMVAEEVGKKCPDGKYYFQVEIDTSKLLLDEDGNIDEESSVKFLCKEADRLSIPVLAGIDGWIDLHSIRSLVPNLEIIKKSGIILSKHDVEIITFLESQRGKKWLESVNSISQDSPFTSFIGTRANGFLFEIHVEGSSPSEVSQSIESGFINQLKRKINHEINEGQLESNNPNIIVIQGLEWGLVDFENDFYDFKLIKKQVEDFFATNSYPDLTGVFLFSVNFDKGTLIKNEKVSEYSKIDDDTIKNLGMKTDHPKSLRGDLRSNF